eukprot:CAMPEP_0184860920 /NCGR_PEP_ID=MMETSP0580-20130426/5711_1 /TAXON_ID=1118495 /ORGANISM="Dactyliosolen fragilissimus" /LENGTH=507 /DNA_ID=CAMNT_0027358195 /DNA_START=53 /DNA_END=1573 /DNA_ORIENTATION=-
MEEINSKDNRNDTVQLGFSQPYPSSSLQSPSNINETNCNHDKKYDWVGHRSTDWTQWDGGQIGGKPSWLDPVNIPNVSPLRCDGKCRGESDDDKGTPLRFIVQIYCPADEETGNKAAFHRSLYVFACPHPLCSRGTDDKSLTKSVVVLRCQLPRENPFYPYDVDDNNGNNDHDASSLKQKLNSELNTCVVCHQRAKGRCPKQKQWFCGKEHQKEYSKYHDHNVLLPSVCTESELVVEDEPPEKNDHSNGNEEKTTSSPLFSTSDDNAQNQNGDDDIDDALLEQKHFNEMTGQGGGVSDPVTLEFYTRIGRGDGDVKGQCLRFRRWPPTKTVDTRDNPPDIIDGDGPLWVESKNCPEGLKDTPPPCQYCGSERKFEFQIMPQMLNFLDGNKNKNDNMIKNVSDDSMDGKTSEVKQALQAASDIIENEYNKTEHDKDYDNNLTDDLMKKQDEITEKICNELLFKRDNELGDMDWGTIAIYTCTSSCGNGSHSEVIINDGMGGYKKEFAW